MYLANKIVATLDAFRLAMESVLRALILADEDGSIRYLHEHVLSLPNQDDPHHVLSASFPGTKNTKQFAGNNISEYTLELLHTNECVTRPILFSIKTCISIYGKTRNSRSAFFWTQILCPARLAKIGPSSGLRAKVSGLTWNEWEWIIIHLSTGPP